jgi:hypothetical protein
MNEIEQLRARRNALLRDFSEAPLWINGSVVETTRKTRNKALHGCAFFRDFFWLIDPAGRRSLNEGIFHRDSRMPAELAILSYC